MVDGMCWTFTFAVTIDREAMVFWAEKYYYCMQPNSYQARLETLRVIEMVNSVVFSESSISVEI